jgi:hypothetical protein
MNGFVVPVLTFGCAREGELEEIADGERPFAGGNESPADGPADAAKARLCGISKLPGPIHSGAPFRVQIVSSNPQLTTLPFSLAQSKHLRSLWLRPRSR